MPNGKWLAISDQLQGMILLKALPPKWDNIGSIYTQTTPQLTNVSFDMVRTAVMVEFERTSYPNALAANKISVVKHKGKSPTFSEQKSATNRTSKAPADEPSQGPCKKTHHGGKGRKRGMHEIMSSALIPEIVAQRMQEMHQPAIIPTAEPSILIGGLSQAPVSAHAITVASFKPSGVTYSKVSLHVDMQVYTGCHLAGPHTYVKAMKKGLISKEPSPAPEAGPSPARQKSKSPSPQNAVALSSSVVLEDIPELVEHIYAPTSVPSLKEWLQSLPPTSSWLAKYLGSCSWLSLRRGKR